MEQNNNIDNLNNSVWSYDTWEVDFVKYDKLQKEHEQSISILKDEESKKSSEKIKQLTWELFNEDVDLLKSETIPPIEGIKNMQILWESEALHWFVKSLYEISNLKCNEWLQDDLVMENISWKTINSHLSRAISWENVDENQIRQFLYKLTDNTVLYKEIMERMWWPFILWVNDRWNRWWDLDGWRWIHMWVDYNLPKWEPIKSIYDWIVVAKRSWTKITGDKTVIKHINDIYWEDWWKSDNILIIKHNILWKIFYSLYIHISDEENISVGSTVKKWQEIWKIDWYETNGHRQPHLHFTIMKTLDSRPMISWYLSKLTVDNDEKDEKYQKLYDEKYGKDMINPMDVYN